MGILTLKRKWSRSLPLRDSVSTSGRNPSIATEQATAHKQVQSQPRSSPKASVYEHSPPHSGTTLHDPDHAPSRVSIDISNDATPSDTLVHVMTVGDSVITVETHRADAEEAEQPKKTKKKSFNLRRVKTAPGALHRGVAHGSVTTIESTPSGSRLRAWSYPQVNWKKLNFVRRVRRSADRKHARKGKAPSRQNSGRQSHADSAASPTQTQSPLMSGAVQASPPRSHRASYGTDICPRASACLGIEPPTAVHFDSSPRRSPPNSEHPSGEHVERKDSHFPEAKQAKDKVALDLEAVTVQLTSDKQTQGSSSFLLHPFDWLRQHHNSAFPSSSSDSSSSSSSMPPSPTTRPARLARRSRETYSFHRSEVYPTRKENINLQTALGKSSMCSTREQLYMESGPKLPPGLEVPEVGHAGPSDWIHRGWAEHYRREAEVSNRACHPLAAARFLPTKAEESKRYSMPQSKQEPFYPQAGPSASQMYAGTYTRAWDFAFDTKGKRRQDTCVTTVTLDDCDFEKV
ncbi:hypothetical protein D6D04_10032 [Aureobasidium pullulans]|nr:hypothetical protein D6D04_10032 [Aureobasidium pullulans]